MLSSTWLFLLTIFSLEGSPNQLSLLYSAIHSRKVFSLKSREYQQLVSLNLLAVKYTRGIRHNPKQQKPSYGAHNDSNCVLFKIIEGFIKNNKIIKVKLEITKLWVFVKVVLLCSKSKSKKMGSELWLKDPPTLDSTPTWGSFKIRVTIGISAVRLSPSFAHSLNSLNSLTFLSSFKRTLLWLGALFSSTDPFSKLSSK